MKNQKAVLPCIFALLCALYSIGGFSPDRERCTRMIWVFQGIILTTRDTARRKESKRIYSPLHKVHAGVEGARIAYK